MEEEEIKIKMKWAKLVCRVNKSKMIAKIFIFFNDLYIYYIKIYIPCHLHEKEELWYNEHFMMEWRILSLHFISC